MRRVVPVAILLLCLFAAACGGESASQFGGATTAAGGEAFVPAQGSTTVATSPGTGNTAASSTTTTTTIAETTVTAAPMQLGPTCANSSLGYTISYPVGWHVDGEDVNWDDYPSDDLACRLYGPNPFVDPGGGGQEWLMAKAAQGVVTIHFAPDVGFGVALLPRDLGYLSTADLLAYLQEVHGVAITDLGNPTMPTWRVEGWMWNSRVYGYVIQSWPGCHPLQLGTSSTDEASVAAWAPLVDAMLASLVTAQNYSC